MYLEIPIWWWGERKYKIIAQFNLRFEIDYECNHLFGPWRTKEERGLAIPQGDYFPDNYETRLCCRCNAIQVRGVDGEPDALRSFTAQVGEFLGRGERR